MNNTQKRITAGILSLALVTGAVPVNVGGLLTAGTEIVANAAGETFSIETLADDEYYCNGCLLTAGTTITFEGIDGPHIIFLYALSGESQTISVESAYTLERDCWARGGLYDIAFDDEPGSDFATIDLYETGDANTFVENNGVYTSNTAGKNNTVANYAFTAESAGPLYWRVDSENFDELFIYVNGEQKLKESGANKTGSLNLNAGDAVRVLYVKDIGTSANSDCAKFRFDKPFPAYHAAVAPGCTTNGTVAYWYDETNQVYYLDADGVTEATYPDDIVVSATGHKYGAPVWSWSDDYSQATATFTCEKNDDTKDVQAEITSDKQSGKTVYTAKVTLNGNEYTDVKEVEKAAGETIHVSTVVENSFLPAGTTISFEGVGERTIDLYVLSGSRRRISPGTTYTLESDCWVYSAAYIPREEGDESTGYAYICLLETGDRYTFVENNGVYTSNTARKNGTAANYAFTAENAGSLNWRVDSEDYDRLYIFVNGELKLTESGADKTGSLNVNAGDAVRVVYVKDGADAENSDCAQFSFTASLIASQPKDVTFGDKQNVTFSVEAAEGSTYQWYYRKGADAEWTKVRNNGTSASYTTGGSAARDGWQFYCEVTKDGRTVDSETATMHYETNYTTFITAQPEDITTQGRQNVTFEVASIEGCTYQWYYRKSATSRWIFVRNNGTSASYTTAGLASRDGWQFCCKVMKNGASELSDVATLNYQSLVTTQPEDAAISARRNVTFEVASVTGCTYQWYYRKSADSRWIMVRNNGTSASYTTAGLASRDGWQFCCKVMQGNASELSEVATLHYQGVK